MKRVSLTESNSLFGRTIALDLQTCRYDGGPVQNDGVHL